MKKRFVSLLLAISMILSLMPVSAVTAFAEGESSGAVATVASGFCGTESDGKNLSWTLDSNGVLTITGDGAMKNYDYYNSPGWYQHTNEITSVVFNDGITRIGDLAFDGCTNIKKVSYTGYTGAANNALPESVTKIGYGAFRDAGVTGTLELPKNLTAIGVYAFYRCKNLTGSLTIPENVTEIGYYTFSGCSGLTGPLTIPKGVTSIGESAFKGCESLTGPLTIPEGVKTIGESAFNGCKSLTGDLKIPDTVTAIGKDAFYKCSGFHGKLSLSNNLSEICSGTFWGCSGLTGTLTIPENVTKIGSCAFRECENLTGDLYIPDTVTEVGGSAFEWCSGFNGTIHISNSLKEIEEATFKNCSSLTGTLTIPGGVTTIKRESFSNCSQLTGKLVIPDSVMEIYGGGYDSTKIWDGAFEDCKGFTALQLSNSLTRIPEYAFDGCSGLTGTLTIPESVTEIGYYAFQGCKNLTGPLTIPNQVKKIGKGAFEECTGLTGNLTIPENVTTIDQNAFYDCGFTGSVDLSQAENLKVIDEGTFEGCKNLKKVYLSNHITSIRQNAFNRMGKAKIYYPDYKDPWLNLAKNVSNLNDDKNEFISGYYDINPMPVCYYCDVTFDPKGGTFDDNTTAAKTYQKIYRTELVETNEANSPVPKNPTRTGYKFNGWYYLDANQQEVRFDPATDGVPDTMTLYADWTQTGTTATVAISGITAGQALIKGKEYPFKVTVTPHDDTGAGKLNLGLPQNAELWYEDTAGQWKKVDNSTLDIDFGTTEYQFKLVPKEPGVNTLTVGVQKDGMTTDNANKDSVSFTVRDYIPATVTISGPTDNTVKAGEGSDVFTVAADKGDTDAAKAKFDFAGGKVQYRTGDTEEWLDLTSNELSIDDLTGKQFRVVPDTDAVTAQKTMTVKLMDASGNEIAGASDSKTFDVTARVHATVEINELNGKTIRQNKPYTFTVTVIAHDDSGETTLRFDNVAGLTYNNAAVTDAGVTVTLTKNQSETLNFTLTPSETGSKSLKAALSNGAANTADYTVSEYVNAEVKIDGLSGTVETDTEKEFTVTVTANDDAGKNVTAKAGFTGPAGATITLKKVQYRFGDSGEWQDGMQELNGMNLDINSLELPFNSLPNITYKLTVTFAEAGNYKFDVSLTKKDAAEAFTSDSAEVTVTKKEEPVTPGGGSTGGGENPGENPGGDSGNTNPTPKPDEKPDRKIKIDGGIVEVNGKEVKPDEDGNITVKKGDEITVTVDKSKISDAQVFDQWVIKPDSVLNEVNPKSEKISFTMPAEDVTIEAMTRDASIEDDGPGVLGTGALIATGVVGSAALLYQGHMLGTELYLRYLLPHGAVIPQNRAELAVLLWQDAENPEPVSTTLYSDISDEDSAIQQAARWAVENDLMEQLDADDHPDHFDPFVPVTFSDSIRAWKKAQELKKSVH